MFAASAEAVERAWRNLPQRWRDKIVPATSLEQPHSLEAQRLVCLHGPCWQWLGSTNGKGHGKTHYNGRDAQAHRAIYDYSRGPIPLGKHQDHLCRNRGCVNPFHCEDVTPAENTARGNGKHTQFRVKSEGMKPNAYGGFDEASQWGTDFDDNFGSSEFV